MTLTQQDTNAIGDMLKELRTDLRSEIRDMLKDQRSEIALDTRMLLEQELAPLRKRVDQLYILVKEDIGLAFQEIERLKKRIKKLETKVSSLP